MDIKLITALVGIAGILIAAILSSWGYFYRARIDAKKNARQVLYLLLEIRYATNTGLFDPDVATDKYLTHQMIRLSTPEVPLNKDELDQIFGDMIRTHFQNIINAVRVDIETRLLEPYEESLMELAATNPVLAFSLRGKEKLGSLASHSTDHVNTVDTTIESLIEEEWLLDVLSEAGNELKEETLQELSQSLDNDILMLAKHCSRSDLKECEHVLKNSINTSNIYDFSVIDTFIDKMMVRINEEAKNQNKVNTEETMA